MYIIYIIHIIYKYTVLYTMYIYMERERDDVPNIAGVQ